jgi:oxaloacetate decarboxylase beta subunit
MVIAHAFMIFIGCLLIYLGIKKKYEPLIMVPLGFGILLVNIPGTELSEKGILNIIYFYGIKKFGILPPLIFLGIGAMTDFGPLFSDPKTFILGAAAQIGIFVTFLGAISIGFTEKESASIGIIGGADGPTAIFLTSTLAEDLLGPIALSAYSYMALVPLIQPPIIKLLTSKKERKIKMPPQRKIAREVYIIFPIALTIGVLLVVPRSAPLIGLFMLGNLFREAGVVKRLQQSAQNEIINVSTIFLALAIGSTITIEFLTFKTLKIFLLGLFSFMVGTASGVLFGKILCWLSKQKINPMIGAAGVSAVPMSARVVHKLGLEEDHTNHLLMHAMGPNVAGVIGSAIVAGIFLARFG